jgi:hypothetical protein
MRQSVKQPKWPYYARNKGEGKLRRNKWLRRWQGVESLYICSSLFTRKDRCEIIQEVERNKDTSKMTSLAARIRSPFGVYLVIILHEQYSILFIQTVS